MDYRKYEPIFGSWYITEELGSGAEGSLYRICRTDALDHRYYSALKAVSVPSSKAETASLMAGGMQLEEVAEYYESVLENTTQEFELLAKLKGNSNIASYEDHEIYRHEDGIGWDILIRLEELTPLVKYSIDNPLSEDEVVRMGIDICRGLSLCKKYGIVHRDIKPDNIFISPSGSYKLGDFGIARIIEKTTEGLSRKGTYEYMAPEVYWGRDYGSTVDLYSLGMVMYRYLNDGRMPFMPQSPEAIHADDREKAFVKRINGHEVPAPRCGSEELKRIVLKACAYDRADRYKDAEEMLKDLEALADAEERSREGEKAAHKAAKSKGGKAGTNGGKAGANGAKAEANGRKKRKIALVIAAALCLLIACGVRAAIPKEVTDIDAGDAEGAVEIYIGDELALSCTVEPDRFRDEPVTFTSGDEKVFTVDENSTVHALALGEASLTMSAKEYSEEVTVSVVPKVTSISGIDEVISMTTGDELVLEPVLEPEKFADEPVTYRSGDKKVATVSKSGKLKAAAAGETTLTVESGGCTFEAKVSVADPVIYYPPAASGTSKKKSGSTKKKSSKASKGYFNSSDDEHF
ncbi:MAG: protein kinase [Mogibacterium sp.]|nr:protein kinase [Mogibacterium sp.]